MFGELFGPEQQQADAGGNDADEFAGEEDACMADPMIAADFAKLEFERQEHGASRHLFYKMFHHDIYRRLRVAEIAGKQPWKDRTLPRPLSFDDALRHDAAPSDVVGQRADQQVPSLAACARQFVQVADRLAARERRVAFDKDDDDAIAFVCAASNLRSHVFDIPLQSEFATKSTAGNIVPAIATTNAVIAGFIVIEAIKVLTARTNLCKTTYLLRQPSSNRKLLAVDPEPPNPACFVCQKATQTLSIDTEQTTLSVLVSLLRSELSFVDPQLMLGRSVKYESGDGLDSEERETYANNLTRSLNQLGISNGTILTVDDFSQEMSVLLIVHHVPRAELQGDSTEHSALFRLTGKKPEVRTEAVATTSDATNDNNDDDDDVIELVTTTTPATNKKRAAENNNNNNNNINNSIINIINNNVNVVINDNDDDDDDDGDIHAKKRARTTAPSEEVVVIDDDEE
jgi:ubiquitin-like 1-activating enzyme E1 B